MSRLDRFLFSDDWEGYFSNVVQTTLLRPVSDHSPILLDAGGISRGLAPFWFETMWLKVERFKEMVKNWWHRLSFNDTCSFILASKLKALKALLKPWNRDVFRRVEANKGKVFQRISSGDDLEKNIPLSLEEFEERNLAREYFKYWSLLEEVSWRQKSRELWLKEGDRNTGFFHRMANAHRRKNCLKKIKINGSWYEDETAVKTGIVEAFQGLLSNPGGWRPILSGLCFNPIEEETVARLEDRFTEDKNFEAVSSLSGDKALGPDGFPLAFWQFSWDFLKKEILGFFNEFYEHNRFVRSMNSTFLVLIPKKGDAMDIKDFRPIGLVGGLYKILAKVLANRLKRVVGKVVSEAQNAFVEGRQILDAALIANEAVDVMFRRKESGVLWKLDIEKAYDHLDWDFLLKVMTKMGLRSKWTSWIS